MPRGNPSVSQLRRLHLSVFFASLGLAYVFLIPAFAEYLGATYLELGYIGTLRSLPYMFLPVIMGYMGDRFGRHRIYFLSLFLAGASTLMLATVSSVNEILLLQVLLGIGFALFWPLSEAMVSEAVPTSTRTAEMGVYAVAWASGFLFGPLIGGIIAETAGFRVAFLVAGTTVLTTASLSVPAIRTSQSTQTGSTVALRGGREIVSRLFPVLIVQIPYGIVFAFIVAIFPGYAAQSGLTPFEVGVLVSGFGFTRIGAFLMSGKFERIGEVKSTAFAFGGVAAVMTLIPFNTTFYALLANMCAAGALIGVIYPQTLGYVSKHCPSASLGFAIGVYETIFGIGFTAGPVASGLVAQMAGPSVAYLALAVVALSAIPMLVVSKREHRVHVS